MTDRPDSRASNFTAITVAAWAIAFFGAFAAFFLTPSRDFGLSAGWNKVGVFMSWQAVAAMLALISAVVSRGVAKGRKLRWIGVIPVAVTTVLIAAITAFIIWANADRTPPDTRPPSAVTDPAAPLAPAADAQ